MKRPQPARLGNRWRPAIAHLTGLLLVALAVATPSAGLANSLDEKQIVDEPSAVQPQSSRNEQDATPLHLETLLEEALRANPEIQVVLARVEAAAERPSQAKALPDPVLSGVYRNVGFGSFSLGEEMMSVAGIRFSQGIPYPGKRDLRFNVAERGIDVQAARLNLTGRRIIREVAEAFFELEYIQKATATVEDTKHFLEQFERTAQARYAAGEGIQQDVFKAQVEVSVLLNRLVVLEQLRESAETQINRLVNRPTAAPLGTPEYLEPPAWNVDLSSLQKEAIGSSALVRERATEVERQKAAVELARRERMPDFLVSGSWMNRGDLPDIWEVNVGISLPIYRGSKQDRAVVEAEAEFRAQQHAESDSQQIIAAAVRDEYLRADRAVRLIELFRDVIIPQAQLSLESATAGYGVGRVDFLTVLDNVVTLLTYQVELYRQRTDYLQALVRLEEHLGRSLGATPSRVFESVKAIPVDNGGKTEKILTTTRLIPGIPALESRNGGIKVPGGER